MPFDPLAAAFACLSLSAAASASCFIRLPRPRARRIAFMDQCYSAPPPPRLRRDKAAKKRGPMKRVLATIATVTAVVAATLTAQTPAPQQPSRPTTTPAADPYANNPDAGKTQFPLAAAAGKDSGASQAAP